MAAFRLKSDKQFITPFLNGQGLYVYTYNGEMKDLYTKPAILFCTDEIWDDGSVEVSAAGDLYYEALKVLGVTIDAEKFKELCKDLSSLEEVPGVENIHVNRLGLCIITMWRQRTASFISMRFEYYFGWSKYGVKVPRQNLIRSSGVWNKIDVRGLVPTAVKTEELSRSFVEKNVELVACKRELEEKSKEMAALKKELEEKNVELAEYKELEEEKKSMELTACKKELEWSKKMESLLIKLVEEKEKVNELMMKNQLLYLRGGDH